MSSDYCKFCGRGEKQIPLKVFFTNKIILHSSTAEKETIPIQQKYHRVAAVTLIDASKEFKEVQQ